MNSNITEGERLVKLEVVTEYHARRLHLLENQAGVFAKSLSSIQANLNQIKWIAYGAGIGYLIHSLGITNILKGVVL